MNQLRVVLSIERELYRNLIAESLERHPQIDLVGEALPFLDCLKLIQRVKPHVLIHSWEEGPDLGALLSHAFAMQPHLTVVRIQSEEFAGLMQIPVHSIREVISMAALRRDVMEPVSSHR